MSRDCVFFCFFFFKTGYLHSWLSPSFPGYQDFYQVGYYFFSAPCSPHNYLKCFVFSHMGPTSDLLHTGFKLPALMELVLI